MIFFANILVLTIAAVFCTGEYPTENEYNILMKYVNQRAQNYSSDYSSYDSIDDASQEIDMDPFLQKAFSQTDRVDSRNKKSRTLCTVNKIVKTHESGAQILPRRYQEYECVPFHGDPLEGHSHNMGVCWNQGVGCDTVEKYHYYIKKNSGEKCWILEKRVIKAGCKCFPQIRD